MRILGRCPALIDEMIDVVSQLSINLAASSNTCSDEIPRLNTVENCMKLSQMLTQALESKASPLQQLPNIRPDMMRHLGTATSIPELVANGEERRNILGNLIDDEYQDVLNVCATMPNVEMSFKSEVNEDGSSVTVTVCLKRKNMMDENHLESQQEEKYFVHCPYFPDEKQEGWWLYIADRNNGMLVTAPVRIISLKEEVKIFKFSVPQIVGTYRYSVVLRSDGYLDFDQNLKQIVSRDDDCLKIVDDHMHSDSSSVTDDEADVPNGDSDYQTDNE